jgi:hypothetical protein
MVLKPDLDGERAALIFEVLERASSVAESRGEGRVGRAESSEIVALECGGA